MQDTMQDTINDAMNMALKLACLLTKEQRIKMKYTGPSRKEKEEPKEDAGPSREDVLTDPYWQENEQEAEVKPRNKPLIELTTNNREYSKLCGSNGDTIKAFKSLIKAIEPEIQIELLAADDNADRSGPRIEIEMITLLTEYTKACRTFFIEPFVMPAPGGFCITTTREVPQQMRAACERIFYNIGRSIKERAALTWEVI